MNWRTTLLPLALITTVITGCSAPNEIVPFREGVLRAPSYTLAADYCSAKDLTPKWIGRAPAESGVLFQCY
ncbi:hypothetical protein [Variovorax sp. 770b2]|jgi:hypothetical protein|uniref:hypothetical protein n=1 Tax=Variovorax sp. 770b2 TaxID=1566271 RepID=UPI0008EA8B67|nr:hypothetical protein [Variovorax sp. 770b2]SFP59808.1 hypothetical protein SAMN03159339_3352 [Variovorax sp. 770b2]